MSASPPPASASGIDLCSPSPAPQLKRGVLSQRDVNVQGRSKNAKPLNKGLKFVVPVDAASDEDSECQYVEAVSFELEFDSDCEIVESESTALRENTIGTSGVDDELCVIGTQGANAIVDFAHARHDCIVEPFSEGNPESFCLKCFCYVCDIPASECEQWKTGQSGKAEDGHCHAHQKNARWRSERKKAISKKENGSDSPTN